MHEVWAPFVEIGKSVVRCRASSSFSGSNPPSDCKAKRHSRTGYSVSNSMAAGAVSVSAAFALFLSMLIQLPSQAESAHQAFRRDSGPPQWHHGAFHDVRDSVRSEVRRMLHSRAEVPFQVPLEVNVVLIGFQGDGGYRYNMDAHKFEEFLRVSFPTHRPLCLETGEPIDIEHHIIYNVFHAGPLELLELEKALKGALVPAGTARESDFGREVPLFEVDATVVEPMFQKLYSYLFALEDREYSTSEMNQPVTNALFVINFDKVRLDPREKDKDPDAFKNGNIAQLSEEDMKRQEGDYIYRYIYNGGGSSQVWLGSGRFLVIDLSAGPCTYGKIETEEGSVSIRTLPRLRNVMYPKGFTLASDGMTHDMFTGRLASVIATAVEHVIAPDIRFETVDASTRLLIPIIVLHNHNRYNIMEKGHNYSIDIGEIEAEVKKMVHEAQEVVILGGSYSLHRHEKLAIAVSNAMRGHSLQETKKDGRYHVHTKTYLDGAMLKEEMERSGDVLAAGLLEVADPSLSNKYFVKQNQMGESDQSTDSVLKHKSLWDTYDTKLGFAKRRRRRRKNQEGLDRTYGTRVIPVFVLSLADVDPNLMMEDDSLVWMSRDVVIVLQHPNEKIPLSYVSETQRRHALPYQAQRHILAGLASAVGGVTAPYEKASHAHERAVVNWLWATGCHPFGPFSNTFHISQMLKDVALRNSIYGRVDATLHRTRETSEALQSFASDHLKTPLGEPIKGNKKNKTSTELWLDKFYKKTTNLPEPFPHELVQRLEKYLDTLEEQLVELSSLLYDHKLQEAHVNSTYIFQSMQFTLHYVERVLVDERDKMRCCSIEYKNPVQSSQTYIYGGILLAGFVVYFVVIFFASPVR